MQRISTATRLVNKFGAGKDGFKDSNLAAGITATNLSADWCNGVQEEILALIEQAGLTPSNAALNQMMQAVATIQRQQINTSYTTTGTAPAFAVTLPASAVALATLGAGLRLRLRFHSAGAGSDTLNIGGLGAKSLKQYDASGAKVAAVIAAGQLADVELDSDGSFVILDPLPAAASAAVVFPVGGRMRYPSATAPSGWLICNGAAVSRTAYSALFAVLSTRFGAGDGSTTFNLPDDRDRFPVGAGNLYTLGLTGGSKDAVVVSHTHTATTNARDTGHTHGYSNMSGSTGSFNNIGIGNGNNTLTSHVTDSAAANITATTTVDAAGVSATNANLPPYLADYVIIKY